MSYLGIGSIGQSELDAEFEGQALGPGQDGYIDIMGIREGEIEEGLQEAREIAKWQDEEFRREVEEKKKKVKEQEKTAIAVGILSVVSLAMVFLVR